MPTVGAESVWRMKDVLDWYAQGEAPARLIVCFDEKSVQLIAEKRCPLPSQPGRLQRYDCGYRRNGTRNLFVFFRPFAGWRHVRVTERRTKADFAHCMRYLADELLSEADEVIVVLDNLNTHTPAALYEVFEPTEAKRILDRLEFHCTPKRGSWLNMVEIEIGVLSEQCLDRRIPDVDILQSEIAAWEAFRHDQKATVDCQFTTTDARANLKRLYPNVS